MANSDNIQYQKLKVTSGTYIPEAGIDYPNDYTQRLIRPKKITHPFVMDENYPYYEDNFHYNLNIFLCRMKYWCLVRPLLSIIYGLKIENQSIVRNHKNDFKKGAITICNHAFRWDVPAIIAATHKKSWIPMIGDNMMTDDYWHMKYIGGIPVPSTMAAMKKYNEAFDKHHELGHWFHVFPEGIRWDFYKPLKPFYKGAFSMSYKYNMPLLPLYINYRPRTGIYKWFGKPTVPLITIVVGEPIFPDTTKPRKVEVDELREKAFAYMLKLGGIVENPWPVKPEKE